MALFYHKSDCVMRHGLSLRNERVLRDTCKASAKQMMDLMLITLINTVLMVATVVIHYEAIRAMTIVIPRLAIDHRARILVGVFGALAAHVVEVWIFGVAYFGLDRLGRFGHLAGNYHHSLLDSVYFSFTNYTTLGYGDIEPHGLIRFLTGIEALTGLVMITWTASFLYFEMERNWQSRSDVN